MKNVSSLKSTKTESPKTPGGISKSLLTPCRRIGLSRNWKKAGPSPFVSPLSNSNVEVKSEKPELRKRKKRDKDATEDDDEAANPGESNDVNQCNTPQLSHLKNQDIVGTPSRRVELPRKKKSKVLIPAISECKNTNDQDENMLKTKPNIELANDNKSSQNEPCLQEFPVTTPVCVRSKIKHHSPQSSHIAVSIDNSEDSNIDTNTKENKNGSLKSNNSKEKLTEIKLDPKSNSPNELTKECVVVIQKKIFKTDATKTVGKPTTQLVTKDNSQTIFDSDSDEVPLSHLNNKTNQKIDANIITIDDDDFVETNKKIKNNDKNTTALTITKKNSKNKLSTKLQKPPIEPNPSSQSSNSFDDDDDFENKKTIIVRKTYEKVTKPLKAKSTGSITQRDIEELKARIEYKKKLLLAKAMTKDTEELRGLIKKWQRGCQDALMELMELMKHKYPDKQTMDYSEMLQILKIPKSMVGYDSDNDCFISPDDESIILSKFNNL